jgi:TetR/AcrR family transcriptional regulator, fatty acid metabolism regulator protein
MSIHSYFGDYRPGGVVISKKEKNKVKYHLILEAAVKVFAEQGFYQSTISQIAREAGVADGTIYLYFKNKDDILLQFFGYKTKQVFQSFREEVDKADSARDKLRNLIRRHLEEFQNDKNMAVVYQAEARSNSRLVEKQLQEMSKMYLDITAEIIEQGQEESQIRKDLYVSLVKRFILGAVGEVINTWVLSGGKYDLVSMAEPLVDLIFRGIGSGEASEGQALLQAGQTP